MLNEAVMPVDFATLNEDLYGIVMKEFPNISDEDNIIDTSDPQTTVYRLLNLERKKLLDILGQYKTKYEYEILMSHNGNHVEINKLQ